MLFIHAWIYRTFGIYTKYARKKEREYIKSLGKISELETSLMTGTWQAKYGFCSTMKQVFCERNIKKRAKKRLKKRKD